jgi:hypothetical protein
VSLICPLQLLVELQGVGWDGVRVCGKEGGGGGRRGGGGERKYMNTYVTYTPASCSSWLERRRRKDIERQQAEEGLDRWRKDREREQAEEEVALLIKQAEEVVALLIEPTRSAGALDAVDDDGMSSLMHLMVARKNGLDGGSSAATCGYKPTDIVKMLMKAGADINTSIHSAAYNGHKESITALLQGGAAVDAKLEVRGALLSFMSRALALLLSLSSLALFLGFISSIHAYVGSRL